MVLTSPHNKWNLNWNVMKKKQNIFTEKQEIWYFTVITSSKGYLYTLTGDWYFCTIFAYCDFFSFNYIFAAIKNNFTVHTIQNEYKFQFCLGIGYSRYHQLLKHTPHIAVFLLSHLFLYIIFFCWRFFVVVFFTLCIFPLSFVWRVIS